MRIIWLFLTLSFLFLLITDTCMADVESVGFVKSVNGDVGIISLNRSVKAVDDMEIMAGDLISTGKGASVGIIFEDDTVVSLGPDSEMVVEDFIYNVAENEHSFVTRILKGTFSFISGQIAKLAPKKVKIETPDATLGIRGTKLLVKID